MRAKGITLRLLQSMLLCLALHLPGALADRGLYESEPNDVPADFHPITGEITLYGTMPGQDQDGYLWTVTDEDTRQRWNFHLNGEPGALTIAQIMRIEYADNGVDVTGTETLFKMGTRDGVTPSVHENLAFEPGTYVIGLAQAGSGSAEAPDGLFRPALGTLSFGASEAPPGADAPAGTAGAPETAPDAEPAAYRFTIVNGAKLALQPAPAGRDSRETAYGLRARSEFATFDAADTAWYRLEFSEQDAAQRWDLRVQAPVGRQLQARLIDASGEELLRGSVNDKGRLRFPDLTVPVATPWYLELTSRTPGFVHVISTEAVGEKVSGEEAEPNNQSSLANRLDWAEPVTGRLGGDDPGDYYLFHADEDFSGTLRTLRVEADPPVRLQMCLKSERLGDAQCRQDIAPLELPDLSLQEGDWSIHLDRPTGEISYTLSLVDQGPLKRDEESEPNDRIQFARGLPDRMRIKGRFTSAGNTVDNDIYQVMVSETAQLWRVQAIGDELFELAYYDGSEHQKAVIRAAPGQRRLRLENLFLLPGRHFVRVSGKDGGSYTLLLRPLGPPDPNGELEPNDALNKQRLVVGQTRTGVSAHDADQDHYRFFVANWDHLKLTFTPPPDGLVAPNIYWYEQIIGQGMPVTPGEPMVMQGLFPPGDYHIVLDPRQVSDAEYTLQLERLPRWSCPADCEPNGQGLIWLASPLPRDLVLEGGAGEWRDMDVYQLPPFDADTALEIRSEDNGRLSIGPKIADREYLRFEPDFGGYRTIVPGGEAQRLYIENTRSYRLELVFPGGELEPVVDALPVALALSLDDDTVSGYRVQGQRVSGSLSLSNEGTRDIRARLEAVTSDHRWSVHLEQDRIELPPAGQLSIPVTVRVPADAWSGQSVRISARALDRDGHQTETWAAVAVDADLPPVNSILDWPIPEQMRGGINAAWNPLGATWSGQTPKWATDRTYLRDGLTFDGMRLTSGADGDGWQTGEHQELTIDLPGDEPVPVAGTAINHYGTPGPFFDIRQATLLLSLDGVNFEEVLHFEALPVEVEQSFALEAPIDARFARLRIDSTFREPGAGRLSMAEWKVILEPGYDLSAGAGYNIADPDLGGHLVWDWPGEPYAPRNVMTADDASKPAGMQRGDPRKIYVVGFLQNRAARITRIDWLYADDTREEIKSFERIEVSVSRESSVGPWLPLGELEIDPETLEGVLALDEPTWARFVRFVAYRAEGRSGAAAPGQIRILERPAGEGYLSVLGEWGTDGSRAFYEQTLGLQADAALAQAANTTRSRAAELAPGEEAAGYVSLGKQDHWYRMTVPADQNTLKISLYGDPTVHTVVDLQNDAGESIPTRRLPLEETPSNHELEAVVEPGTEVFFRIVEPPRNVAFSWDTSASVNAYIPLINSAIVAFSGQVLPGREAVNLFPFPTGPLLEDWLGEPYMLQTILNDYRRPSASSAAEVTLKYATQALGPRAGTKAIVVITDGDVNHDTKMWEEFRKTQPRVFTVGVAGSERVHQQLLRDYASVNGGHYSQLRYDGEMEVAFDRATALMRRPAGYRLAIAAEYREAPGPGSLSITAARTSAGAGAAVELILDASGSMLQRLDGKRRITIAKEVLTEAVQTHIPEGTPLALRVFGHREVDSCRTDLELPLAPLDPARAVEKIDSIQAMNLARTPIADSLKAIAGDLRGTRSGVIVLVTDGEETCGGDPAAAIEMLRSQGFNVNVNIVGFAIDDAGLAAQFEEWANLGGGRYFGADNQSGLSSAITEALKVPFTIYDQGGNEVASGQVNGEPVDLEQGRYRVVVRTTPEQTFDPVDIEGEKDSVLSLE